MPKNKGVDAWFAQRRPHHGRVPTPAKELTRIVRAWIAMTPAERGKKPAKS